MEFKTKPIIVDANQWDGTFKGMEELKTLYPNLVSTSSSYHEERNTVSHWRVMGKYQPFYMEKNHWLILYDGIFSSMPPDKFVETYTPCAVGDLV